MLRRDRVAGAGLPCELFSGEAIGRQRRAPAAPWRCAWACAVLGRIGLRRLGSARTAHAHPGRRAAALSYRSSRTRTCHVPQRPIGGSCHQAKLSPHYPWYPTILALHAVMASRPAALWLMLSASALYLDPDHDNVTWPTLLFLPFLELHGLALMRTLRLPSSQAAERGL